MQAIELLNDKAIHALLGKAQSLLSGLEIISETDSTNSYLLRKAKQGQQSGHVCLAEQQHAGRGNYGRNWVSPLGNIYLSVLWRFAKPALLSGLSLAIGVAGVRGLQAFGIENVTLKWPNDIFYKGRKLAGVLAELVNDPLEETSPAVIGVGVNVAMPASYAPLIDQPWIDVQSIIQGRVERNRLAGLLVHHLLLALPEFQQHGLAAFREEWAKLDMTAGQQVTVLTHQGSVTGTGRGIDEHGAFRLAVDNTLYCYPCGEVKLLLGNAHCALTSACVDT